MRSLKDIKLSVTKHPRAVTHPTSSISVRALVILKDKQVSYRHEPASSFPRLVKNKEFPQEFSALRGYVWVESIHQIPSGRLGNGMRILEQIS